MPYNTDEIVPKKKKKQKKMRLKVEAKKKFLLESTQVAMWNFYSLLSINEVLPQIKGTYSEAERLEFNYQSVWFFFWQSNGLWPII